MIWSIADIVQYMDTHGIKLLYVNGKAVIDGNSVKGKEEEVAIVKPHMAARKEELLAHFRKYESFRLVRPGQRSPEMVSKDVNEARSRVMGSVLSRGGKVWVLLKSGLAMPHGSNYIPKEVIGACVEGDVEWTMLPGFPPEVTVWSPLERRRYWAQKRQMERYRERQSQERLRRH